MGIRSWFLKQLGAVDKSAFVRLEKQLQHAVHELEDTEEEPRDKFANFEDFARAYISRGWVYGCVWRLASAIAGTPLRLYEVKSPAVKKSLMHSRARRNVLKQDENVKEITSHPSLDLLAKPNAWTSGYDLWEATVSYLELDGRAFWVMQPDAQNPLEIWCVRPDWMEVLGGGKDYISGYTYQVEGRTFDFGVDQVIYLRYFHPLDDRKGGGTVPAARAAVQLDEYAIESNRRYFQNDGAPGGVLMPPETSAPLSKEDLERYERMWQKLFQGVKRKHRTAVLPPGWDYKGINPTLEDMQFLELRKFNREEIMAATGVPPALIGVLEYSNYANMEAQERYFWLFSVKPRLRKIESALNEFYFSRWGENLYCEFDISEYVPENEETEAKTAQALVTNGLMTINEWRAEKNLPKVPWGDTWYIPATLIPVTELEKRDDEGNTGDFYAYLQRKRQASSA